jgi:tetratricopeptide (TPR) repeat protein
MLPNVSPCGRYVLAGVKDRTVFLPREDLLFSQIFFPVMGILAYYDRTSGRIAALPGADDEDYVQTNAAWSPGGEDVIFARNDAVRLKTYNPNKGILLNTEESAEVLGGEQYLYHAQQGANPFRFSLYRVPFRGGRGGEPVPIEGASHNGMSNFFPKVSPDGKWLVFTQAHSYMLLQPDSKLYIMPAAGGEPRLMNANTDRMNSWHSWSPNGRWLVFSTKMFGPYTQLFLTHIDEDGNDSPPVWLRNFTASDRAANIPEFVNVPPDAERKITEAFVDDYNYFRSGRVYEQFLEYDRAEEEYLRSLQLNPDNTFALYSLGTMYANRDEYENAKRAFQRILEVDPDAAIVHKDLGTLYFKNREYSKAQQEFETAVRLEPGNAAARFNLGTIHLMNQRHVEAEAQFREILRLDTDTATAVRVHMNLARIYVARRDHGAVLREYFGALALDSTNIDARHNLGVTYRAINDLVSAQGVFENLVQLAPDNVAARLELGQVYAHRGAHTAAIEQFETVLQTDPHSVPALMYLGRIYYEIRDYEKALRTLKQAAAQNPNNVYVHVNLGRVCYEMGRWDEAVSEFRWVTEANPSDPAAHFMLGEALIKEGRSLQEAVTAFQNGLKLDPSHIEAHVSLGDVYGRLESYDQALAEFEAALRLEPADPALRNYLNSRIADIHGRTRP